MEKEGLMRKHIISHVPEAASEQEWLNLEGVAEVEVTSEDANHPIEEALLPSKTGGWRASQAGEQTIRLLFNEPQRLKRIWLNFVESERERTQQYVLRWSSDGGQSFHEIVRQQWNFSPPHTTNEVEDHQVEILSATVLELRITPDISAPSAFASIAQMRMR
jgi:hypothetical protein